VNERLDAPLHMDAAMLADAVGRTWGCNDLAGFVALFWPDGDIVHPYFKQPISPRIAMEVMNAAVKGTTRLKSFAVLSGSGEGVEDIIEMLFEETGTMSGGVPEYIGRVKVLANVSGHKIARMTIAGFELVSDGEVPSEEPSQFTQPFTSYEIAGKLASSWGGNDMSEFLSLFSLDALIVHPMLQAPARPKVVADVMNCNVKGETILRSAVPLTGDGSGVDDVMEMEFEETGNEIGYAPPIVGRMSITATIQNHRIVHMKVFGYQVAASPQPAHEIHSQRGAP